MLEKNEYGIEPGPYTYQNGDGKAVHVVVTTIVNYSLNTSIHLSEVLPTPFVVYRDLMFSMDHHRAYIVDLEYFKKHFHKK